MTDLDNLKQTLISIGCNYESCQTLIGYNITIKAESRELFFEFDENGEFLRVI